ncbi:MAG: hypothetical protein LBI10_04415 [Deltaproteobacteria bacterium]|jgi:hypothetical protein|nr:hypothetical protein [Deltaproteobacteria bacterium]
MKIINFKPKQPINRPQGFKNPLKSGFGETYPSLANSAQGLAAVVAENLKASQGASLEDLGAAGTLVKALIGQIRSTDPQKLQKLHDLDGVLYYYQV